MATYTENTRNIMAQYTYICTSIQNAFIEYTENTPTSNMSQCYDNSIYTHMPRPKPAKRVTVQNGNMQHGTTLVSIHRIQQHTP